MTYRASGRKSASARRPVGHFTSKECAMNLGINAISLQPLFPFIEKLRALPEAQSDFLSCRA